LLDLALPILDGWEVLRLVRKDPEIAATPIVVVTAHGDSETAARAKARGADGFLSKPFQPAQLRKIVDQFLSIKTGQ
jgi:two-component system chemotaxis response regulator CheY